MAAWRDIEFLLVQWYREGDRDAWADLESLQQEQEDLSVTQQHMVHKFDSEENVILIEMQWHLDDRMARAANDLIPQRRLATADRSTRKSLSW
jgi:hypothetical protein